MIAFIIKSTISLFVVYTLYKIFLAGENMPVFKRFFLLFGMLFSVITSLVHIKTNIAVPETITHMAANYQIQEISPFNAEVLLSGSGSSSYITWIIYGIYFLISVVLSLRYILNLRRLIKKEKNNRSHEFEGYKIVLLMENVQPFSFLRTIYINSNDYNNGAIRKEVLIHELAHIRQKHSIDILLAEFLQIICWFNPLLWLYKKEIRLNHEYLADREVINRGIDIPDYQNFILGFVFRNNSSYLASSFNYSFIKKRFIMLTKEKSSVKAYIKAAIVVPIIVLLALALNFNQEALAMEKSIDQAQWWEPIVKKHQLDLKAYSNYENVFEIADNISSQDGVDTLTDNAILVVKKDDNEYLIIRGTVIKHHLENGMIEIKAGRIEGYNLNSSPSEPISVAEGTGMTLNIKKSVW